MPLHFVMHANVRLPFKQTILNASFAIGARAWNDRFERESFWVVDTFTWPTIWCEERKKYGKCV